MNETVTVLGPRDKPYGFFSVLAGTTVSLQDKDDKKKKMAETYSLVARNQHPNADKRALSAMNSVHIDSEIDSN